MPKSKTKISRENAIEQLWRMGNLEWKLTDVQKKLKNIYDNDVTKTSVIVVSRRTGKSYLMCIEAIMQCLKVPGSVVKFVFPKQKDAKTNIRPLMRMILQDCPADIKPEYNTQDKIYYFKHNGSEIQLAGCDNGNIESIRGGFAHLCIVDEAGYCDDLTYAIRSVLSPTIRTTGGRIILASTPSKSAEHEFVTNFMNPYKAANRLKIFTIYDNPNFDENIIKEIIADYPRGEEDPDFRREYLCEVGINEETAICPEFTRVRKDIIVEEYEVPEFCDYYVGLDIGYRDLTVALFGYYDFDEACLYIVDELVMNGPEMTTDKLAQEIMFKEKLNFFKNNKLHDPLKRVMDIDLKLQNDLNKLHGIKFSTTKKDNRDAAINQMRMWVSQRKVKIHQSCKHLIYHLEYGQWNSSRSDFKRLNDSPDKTIRGGHVDAIPALYYLIRNIKANHNPYPAGYGININKNTFISPKWEDKRAGAEKKSFMNKLLNIKK